MTNLLALARQFKQAVLSIVEKEGQPATLGTAGGTVYYNDGVNEHKNRVWVRMGSDKQALVLAKTAKKSIPNAPGLEVTVTKRYGSIYVTDWESSAAASTVVVTHVHDYDTRNVIAGETSETGGTDNVVAGYMAGANLESTADKNVIIGAYAGENMADGDGNVLVGYKAAGGSFVVTPVFGSSNKISADDDMSSPTGWNVGSEAKMVAVLSPTKVVLGHVAEELVGVWYIEACVANISGNTVTEGSWYTLDTSYNNSNNPKESSMIEIDSDTFLYAWWQWPDAGDYILHAVAGNVSGTTISIGTQQEPSPRFEFANPKDVGVCRLSDTKALVVAAANNGSGKAWVVSISGNSISWGTGVEFATQGNESAVEALSDSKFVVFYTQSLDAYAKVGTVSGTTISFGSAYLVATDATNTNANLGCTPLSDSLVVFAWEETDAAPSNRYKYLRAGTISGTVITLGTPVTVGTTSGSYYSLYNSLDKIDSTTFILRYDISGGADDNEIAIGTVSGTTITLDGNGPWDSGSAYDDLAQIRYLGGGKAIVYGADETTLNTMDAVIVSGLAAGAISSNTFIGANAGENNVGAGGVCIGRNAGDSETVDSRLHINNATSGGGTAPLVYGEFDDDNLGINTTDMGAGTGVIGILSATVVPDSNPTGGGALYVEGGALKYRGSSGTVTPIANA